MRTRLVLGMAAALLLVPQGASATCVMTPFDRVVRQADAVLVGTVVDAGATREQGIVIRLRIEQVLKGTAETGFVSVGGCGPVIPVGKPMDVAEQMIGTRGLYLLQHGRGGKFSTYTDITSPWMTLDEEIARARAVLALPEPKPPTVGAGLHEGVDLPWWLWPLVVGAIVLVFGGAVILLRRSVRHRESRA